MSSKTARQKMIQKLIESEDIATQSDLAQRLFDHGYYVTQATVSRDIKEIGLVKIPMESNLSKYSMPANLSVGNVAERTHRMFMDSAVSLDNAGNLIIVKTLPGTANGLAACLDQCGWDEVAGSLAGDDTIFVAIRNQDMIPAMMKRFEDLMI